MVEPLRDFNGYSWTTIPQEIESIDHNLIYQDLRILVGHEFLNKWIKNNEFIIDYYYLFKEKIENQYGKKNEEKLIDLLSKISILLGMKFNKEKYNDILEKKEEIETELEKMQDKEKFIEEITQNKKEIKKRIKQIDETINNKNMLQEEYIKRNEQLPLEKKIFSMRILSKIMAEEKEKNLKKYEYLNELMNPQNFVKYKNELEKKDSYLKILNSNNQEQTLEKLKLDFQKQFLKMLEVNIKNVDSKQEIEKIIYDFRYYSLLQYNNQSKVKDIEELREDLNEISTKIIDKAIEYKVLEKISNNEKTNNEILKNIFKVRIIKLEDAYLKITKEKDKYFFCKYLTKIYLKKKVEIKKPEELEIKINKKKTNMGIIF